MHHRGMENPQLDELIADMRDVVDQLERVDIDDMRRRLAALEELLAPPEELFAKPASPPVLRLIQGGEGHSNDSVEERP